MSDLLIWVGAGFLTAAVAVAGFVALAVRAGEKMIREDPYWDM